MTTSAPSLPSRSIVIFIAGFALLKMLIHLYTNAFQSYGIFRDEMYYLACADHLDWGYVDQPPLSIWILFLVKSLLG